MEITIDQLRSRYESLETEDLLLILAQGGLTEEAEIALQTELRARGYADRGSALQASVAVKAANAEALRQAKVEQRDGMAKFHVVGWVCFFVIPTAVAACMPFLAPLIWRSPADHACQKAGYWYAEEVGLTKIHCGSWKPR
jgi:hypothetical protein